MKKKVICKRKDLEVVTGCKATNNSSWSMCNRHRENKDLKRMVVAKRSVASEVL